MASWLVLPVGFGGGPWWKPLGAVTVVGSLTLCYVLWRVRTLWRAFDPSWIRDTAERAGWSPRAVEVAGNVLWVAALGSVVVSWLT